MKIENGVITDIRLQTIVPHLKARTILGKSLNPDMIKNILNLTTRLKSLRTLSLIDLRLKTLPESFGTLEDLKELYLRDPSFRKLPETFGDLKSQIPPNPNAYR